MAQAIKNKDVRKNCVDVEDVVIECLSEAQNKEILELGEPGESLSLRKEILKLSSKNNAKYYQELIPIKRVDQRVNYRNYILNY